MHGVSSDTLIKKAINKGHSDEEISKAVEQGSFAYLMHRKSDKIRQMMHHGPVSMVIINEIPENSIIVEVVRILPFDYELNILLVECKHDGKSFSCNINELSSPEL